MPKGIGENRIFFVTPVLSGGVSDPNSLCRIRIRIQHCRMNTDPDPIQIQGFYDQKLKKTAGKNGYFFDQKL
jgi:hypothetical protein